MDTGSPFDLLGKNEMTQYEKQTSYKSQPCEMLTANGVTTTRHKVDVGVMGLPEEKSVSPHILPECPPVLSIGRRCVKMGYMFIWEPFSNKPLLISPSGKHLPEDDEGAALAEFLRKKYSPKMVPPDTELVVDN